MRHKKWFLIALLLAALAGPACALESWLLRARETLQEPTPFPTPAIMRATLYPTMTPKPSPTVSQAMPTVPPPAGENTFRLELSEQELAAFIAEQGGAQEGLSFRDARILITEEQILVRLDASHAESGLSGEITLVTVPHVVEGTLYLQILDYRLGSSLSGFARLVANALIKAALESHSTPEGIPIPVAGVAEIYSVELRPGFVVITGRFQ